MERIDERDRQIRAIQKRLSSLSEASLRISESLDLDTVLQGVIDSARELTGAHYGGVSTVDDTGQPKELFTSGMTPDEQDRLEQMPDGLVFFQYVLGLTEPIRIPDLPSHFRSMGLPDFKPGVPAKSLLAISLRNQDTACGTIYLSNVEGEPEFTAEDEETLVMFASQAALVIANARRHQAEQKARSDLEALINTSPVGVAVFDARTGAPVSFNQEVLRILEDLRQPGSPPEQLLETLTVRRADGREVSLDEFNLSQLMSAGETVRAEEIELRNSDGRIVNILVNATPIRSDEGEVETFIVTVQDMTQLQEVERLRAEYLAMVSHELRTPLAAAKGSVTTLLDPPAPLSSAEMKQFHLIIDAQINRMHVLISDLLDVARIETGTLAVAPEPTDFAILADEAHSAFRSGGGSHTIEIDIAPDMPWVMADRMRILQLLSNLLTNAARHSAPLSPIRVSVVRDGVHVAVAVSDQGRGILAESLPHLFRKFSQVETDDQGGDTGLGLAICKGIAEAHGGRIWAESDGPGLGARFTFTLPTVEDAGYISPSASVRTTIRPSRRRSEQVRILAVDDEPEALRYVRDVLVKADYAPIVTPDPEEALRLMEEEMPHLALLDLMLPGTDGIELMTDIIGMADVPVIFVSAYGQDHLVARALNMGAADYVVKPFSPTELEARIKAALRRRDVAEPSEPYVLGDLVIDYAARLVTLGGTPVRLTAIEYQTLAELSANAGRVSTYAHLLSRVWNTEEGGEMGSLRTIVNTLRRRLGDDAKDPRYIFTELRVRLQDAQV